MIIKFEEFLNESSEFNQYQMGLDYAFNSAGPGYGFATDPGLSIYSNDTSPYVDFYARTAGTTSRLMQITKQVFSDMEDHLGTRKNDRFLLDIDEFKNLKILRIHENENMKINIYISFDFMEEEFFGVYRNFNNTTNKPRLESELFSNPKYSYMDKEYYLKLNQYLYKKLFNFFIPKPGLYRNLKPNNVVKSDDMGNQMFLKEGKIVEVLGYNLDESGDPFISLIIDGKKFNITGSNYFYFKWRFESTDKKDIKETREKEEDEHNEIRETL